MIYGLCIVMQENSTFSEPIIYSTNLSKLDKLGMRIVGTHWVKVGSFDITNAPEIVRYSDPDKYPMFKIEQMPTLN